MLLSILPLLLAGAEPAPYPDPYLGPSSAPACASARSDIDAAETAPTRSSFLSGTAIVTVTEPWCGEWTVITIYMHKAGTETRWYMRRTSGSGVPAVASTTRWADSRACPKMLATLDALQALPIGFGIGRPRRPPLPYEKWAPRPLHKTSYRIRSGSVEQPSGRSAALDLSAMDGEVADWGAAMMRQMTPCWTDRVPDPD
jgi:hypothetical protein